MNKVVILVLLCCTIVSQAQTDLQSSTHTKSGRPTLDEWMKSHNYDRFEQAIPSLLVQKEKKENEIPFKEDDYYDIVMSLHECYMQIGDVASSQKLLSSAMRIYVQKSNRQNSKFTRALWLCMGQLEMILKNYGQALAYLNQAQLMLEEANDYGEDYVGMLMNMAISYQANGDILSAKIYMDEAKEHFEKLHGSIFSITYEEHFMLLSNYGYISYLTGHETEAEKCFKYIIDNCKRSLHTNDVYSLACNNLSAIYMMKGKWSECAKMLERLKSENDERNYLYAQNLALCYFHLKKFPKAITALQDMNNYSLSNVEKIFSSFTGVERENYWTVISKERLFFNNLIAYYSHDNQAVCMAYDNAVLCKNLLLNSTKLIDRFVSASASNELKQQQYTYQQLKNELAYKTRDQNSKDSLAREIIDVEKNIISAVGNLGQWLGQESKSWKDIQQSLDDREIAIEYSYAPQIVKFPDKNVQFRYIAFVIRKDYNYPKLISLEDIDSIKKVVENDSVDELFINDLYASDKTVSLHKMIWEKLTPYLKGIKTIYYSPTGQLSNINFDVLRGEDGIMLNQKYSMCRVSSTANIRDAKSTNSQLHSAVLYGNIKYDETAEEMEVASSSYETFSGTIINYELAHRSEDERGKWGLLSSTKTEIDNIKSLLSTKKIGVYVCEGDTASEESFKNLNGKSPEILHLATHGFVIDTPKKAEGNKFVASTNVYSQKDSYMMWAGLMLAGGNNIWQGKFDLTNVEDGILTADEISRMDLSNTKLAVLSACETARGKVDPVDGVYGLQRAFKMAGVGTIVMSLWKVQDESTSMLMTQFYTYLTSGVEKHHALWKAMMDVREKYKDPYYWAGFIMLD